MAINPNKDTRTKAATKQRIIETGFRLFAGHTIDGASLADVANAAGVSMATVYNYYSSKEALAVDISAWMWRQYIADSDRRLEWQEMTAAEVFAHYLESFIDLYRNHRDLLRFNQFFNVYIQRQGATAEQVGSFTDVVDALAARFHELYEKGKLDGTLRTDMPEKEMFSKTLHLMLAVVTRYAVGLVYDLSIDPEEELKFERDLLFKAFIA